MKNQKAHALAKSLLIKLYDIAKEKGKTDRSLVNMCYRESAQLDNLNLIANRLGFWLVIEAPEERGKWYNSDGHWRELVKRLVFHWWNRKDEELLRTGRADKIDNLCEKTELRRQLEMQGLSPAAFTEWLKNRKVPTFDNFCLLAQFEGFGVDWREIPLEDK